MSGLRASFSSDLFFINKIIILVDFYGNLFYSFLIIVFCNCSFSLMRKISFSIYIYICIYNLIFLIIFCFIPSTTIIVGIIPWGVQQQWFPNFLDRRTLRKTNMLLRNTIIFYIRNKVIFLTLYIHVLLNFKLIFKL